MKVLNMFCPRCGKGGDMRLLEDKNVGELNVVCLNCQSYYLLDALLNNDKENLKELEWTRD